LAAILCFGAKPDPAVFPIAVWLQSPSNAAKYKAAGFNLYVGLWQGPTEEQLTDLKAAGMPVVCEQNAVGLRHLNDSIIYGWMLGDEPDNAQAVKDPVTGKIGYGPCIPPEKIVAEYERYRRADPTRPVMLNLGQGVANDEWYGRGSGASLKDYETYVKGGDIVSFDVYPIAGLSKPDPEDYLWYVPKGVDRLVKWMNGKGTAWNCIECTRIDGDRKATPSQVRSEVWMSLIHGSKGLIYFVHQFKPTFDEHALLDDPEMLAEVKSLNGQIASLAAVLNSPPVTAKVAVTSSKSDVPVDIAARKSKGEAYVFAVGMRNSSTRASFDVHEFTKAKAASVLGENRAIPIVAGTFSDDFMPYAVHLYKFDR
jgi:hypothetical protein